MSAMRPTDLPCCRPQSGDGRAGHQQGFSLIELIMVIVILGVLAVFAAPRVFDSTAFNVQGFHDGTLAYLRFAQKTAIAQRRTVCVTFGPNSVSLASASNTPTNVVAANDCSTAIAPASFVGPDGKAPPTLTATSSVVYSTTPSPVNFNFNGLGQPIAAAGGAAMATQTIQVVGAAPKTITIEATTGFVHD